MSVRQSLVALALWALMIPSLQANDAARFTELGQEYAQQTRPLLKQFCLGCHSTAKQEGELDLERFAQLSDVRKDTKAWLKVVEMLDNGEMPPKDFPKQPSVEQKKQLRSWVERYLHAEALANAGDPGPVVLRRLSNAEYTYTIRDLTGTEQSPAKEFPTDSAAGEGFTNTGNSLVMSPSLLTKYLDAGKEVAKHAVLLPDGFRFSPSTSRSDWTNDTLARIRDFYREHSDVGGGTKVNLQGIVFDTNSGGRLAIDKYLAATLAERDALASGSKSVSDVAKARGLNAKYLGLLWSALTGKEPSVLLESVRAQWQTAKPEDAGKLAAEIGRWQQALWRFTSVGHIGKLNGPKAWQEPVLPLTTRQELRVKLNPIEGQSEVMLYLTTTDAGDGSANDFVVWERPRFVVPGRPDLLLKNVRVVSSELVDRRNRLFASATKCLAAAAEASAAKEAFELATLAQKHGVDADALAAWLDYLGVGTGSTVKIDSHFTQKIPSASGYDFIKGWGPPSTPNVSANSSDNHVRIPGNMRPHSIAMHPAPTLNVVAGWKSPVNAVTRIEGKVQHAHPECGNGVTWSLELRRGNTRQRLATGVSQGAKEIAVGPIENVAIKTGDLVSMVIGPRDGNHSCDLTAVDLTVKEMSAAGQANAREWSLWRDVSPDVLAGNPHADRFGNEGVWHFYTEPVKGSDTSTVIPAGSLLVRWQSAVGDEKSQLAAAVQKLLQGPTPAAKDSPDAVLHRQLSSLGGPLVRAATEVRATTKPNDQDNSYGLEPAIFGKHPNGSVVDGDSLCVQAPSVLEVRLPADLVAGTEFVANGALHAATGAEGSVQLQVLPSKPDRTSGLLPTAATETNANGPWTSNNRGVAYATPVLVNDGTTARTRITSSMEAFRNLFPLALCYTKIVPVDEVVTLTLFYREDDQLQRLMLNDAQVAQLNRLWDELHFVSHDALTLVDAYQQLMEFATQDADPKVFEPLRKPINERAAAFRQTLVSAESKHVDQLVDFAATAYRRPLTKSEKDELVQLYRQLRSQDLSHDEAFRFTLARLFISPAFLYRLEQGRAGGDQPAVTAPAGGSDARTFQSKPVSDWELATRLSYFLGSSLPDDELRAVAAAGKLREPDVLVAQAQRLLKGPRTRRLATEFACQWLHIYDFDSLDEKSEKLFPEFTALRGDLYEESILYFTDLFQRDASIMSVFDADHTFVNERLAKFYGVPFDAGRAGWQRVDGVKQHGRGGMLGMATTLAKQSGASRTSPILRGNWVSEVLLGDKLPKPPKDVPRLPEDETATDGLSVRQLVERHSVDERCSNCHQRIDPYGFALEGFDAIGRRREKDLAARPIDTKTKLPDGTQIDGLPGLRDYLVNSRRDVILKQFCRKLLGYSLGRAVQLSDEPLLAQMRQKLEKNDFRFGVAVETIVRSQQFQEVRIGHAGDAE